MKRYLTAKEASEYIGISYGTFRVRLSQGKDMPRAIRFDRHIRYDINDLDAFMEAHKEADRSVSADSQQQ